MNKPTCAVRGLVAPGAMCGSIITGGQLCGFKGQCQHQGAAAAQPCGCRPGTCESKADKTCRMTVEIKQGAAA